MFTDAASSFPSIGGSRSCWCPAAFRTPRRYIPAVAGRSIYAVSSAGAAALLDESLVAIHGPPYAPSRRRTFYSPDVDSVGRVFLADAPSCHVCVLALDAECDTTRRENVSAASLAAETRSTSRTLLVWFAALTSPPGGRPV
jgi:hypothetical protein